MAEKQYSLIESMLFTQRMAQLSKALWKSMEKDWQNWIKPYDLNINEHHILSIAYHLKGASISDIAQFGVMHVSTAFNFSKRLEGRGLLQFSKKESDKRNTYVKLTEKGDALFLELMEAYEPEKNSIYQGALPLRDIYGSFPDMIELLAIIRNMYGDDFLEILEKSFHNIETDFYEENGKIKRLKIENAV